MDLPLSYVVVDFETTDKYPTTCGIVEIGVTVIRDGKLDDTWSQVCNPGMPCSAETAALHGITQAEIDAAPPLAEALIALAFTLGGCVPVVAHNADFERVVLAANAERAGVPMPPIEWVCTLKASRAIVPGGVHKLGAMLDRLGIRRPDGNMHRAEADTLATARLVEGLRRYAARKASGAPIPAPGHAAPLAATTHAIVPQAEVAIVTVADDAPPLVAAAAADLDKLAREIARYAEQALALPCTTDAEEEVVVDAIAKLRQMDREATKLRQTHTGELNTIKRAIEAVWREFASGPIGKAIEALERLRKPRALERARAAAAERAAAEARAAELAEQERQKALQRALPSAADAAMQAALSGDPAALQRANLEVDAVTQSANDRADTVYEGALEQAAAIAPRPVVGAMATARDKPIWHVRVVAARAVPSHLCSPDVDKIKAWIEQHNGDVRIPGVEFELDVATTTRARRG